jgi:multidrug efflux pump subunit AcrA (membrane-fusion protein)
MRMIRATLFLSLVISTASVGCGRKGATEVGNQPKDEPAQQPTGVMHLTDESLKLIDLDIITVGHGKMNMGLRAPGLVSFNLNRTAKVTATFEGQIRKLNFDIGDHVSPEAVMVLVDSPEMLNKPLELKAPIEGDIVERQGTVGEILDKGKELYTISDLKKIWVIADVNPNDIAAVGTGQPAIIHALPYPAETFTGAITLVSPEVDDKSRAVKVRVEAENPGAKLKPGMYADVEIVTNVLTSVVVVPDEALQKMDDDVIVFIAGDRGTFTKRAVTTGAAQDGATEILDGLKDGERVVTKGSFLLKSELLKSELGE